MMKRLGILAFICLTVAVLLLGYSFARSNIAADYYRDKLREQVQKTEAMRQLVNEIVKKTVVTELIVNEDDSVCVVFRDRFQEKIVATPFKKGAVVYVDFIVSGNRLILRRLFDEKTAPADALVIDPDLQTVDWKSDTTPRGISPYGQLNQNGRWEVSVTGNGALELKKSDDSIKREPLAEMPNVKDYDQLKKEIDQRVENIGPADVLNSIFGGGK